MRTKTAKKVDLERLAAALDDFPFGYLITVDDGFHAHTVTVEPTMRGATLDVGLIGNTARTWTTIATSRCCGRRPSRAATR